MNFLTLSLIALAILFIFSTRQQKKNLENQKDMQNKIKVGSFVQTYSGIVGEIVDSDDNYYKIKSADTTFVIAKEAVLKSIEKNTLLVEQKLLEAPKTKIELEIMQPKKQDAREKYGF